MSCTHVPRHVRTHTPHVHSYTHPVPLSITQAGIRNADMTVDGPSQGALQEANTVLARLRERRQTKMADVTGIGVRMRRNTSPKKACPFCDVIRLMISRARVAAAYEIKRPGS